MARARDAARFPLNMIPSVTESDASVEAPAQTAERAATAAAVLEFRQAAHVLQDPVSGAMFAALEGAALPVGCVLTGMGWCSPLAIRVWARLRFR